MRRSSALVLADLVERATRYSGRPALADKTIYCDLGIDREDFVEFCEELEVDYELDLRLLFETNGEFRDATVGELAEHISRNQFSS